MQPLRTILVDDNPGFLDSLATLLSRRETLRIVASATGGEEAVALAERLRPDLMIIDLVLPDLDGFEVTRRVRALPSPPCVVLLSLAEHPRYARLAEEAGAQALVNKHDVNARLMPAVMRHCGGERRC